MKRSMIWILAMFAIGLQGCTHLEDLQACRPTRLAPDPFSDAVGWDHLSVDEVWCSDADLKAAQLAREEATSRSVGDEQSSDSKNDESAITSEGNIVITVKLTEPDTEQVR